jgi:tRNA A-37 threonylcarbamoyl transferase component Bud32
MQMQVTQTLVQNLLSEIRENSSKQSELNSEIKSLRMNVSTLSNIITGGNGNTSKSLVIEVEMMKHADFHLDKRMTAIVEDMEDQILSLCKNLSSVSDKFQESMASQKSSFESKLELSDKVRREYETARLQTQVAENNDIRLDGRARFQTISTVVIALLALAGSLLTLILK